MGRRGPKPDYAKREGWPSCSGQGVSLSEAARTVGVNRRTAKRWRNGRSIKYSDGRVLKLLPVISTAHQKEYSPRYLSEDERLRLADLRRERRTMREIARLLGRSPSTISRELRRGSDAAGRYRPFEAHRRALAPPAGPAVQPAVPDRELRDWVGGQAAGALEPGAGRPAGPPQFPDQPERWLCAETIYQAVYRPDLGGLPGNCPAGCCADAAGNEYPAATPNGAAAAR